MPTWTVILANREISGDDPEIGAMVQEILKVYDKRDKKRRRKGPRMPHNRRKGG